jgi:hypothetical protein
MNILAYNALASFIKLNGVQAPYGNWTDIKYFCNYLKNVIVVNNKNDVTDYQIFKDIIDLYVIQLVNEEKYQDVISTVTQYMPREKSKLFGWIAYYISTTYYQTWMNTATTNESYIRAVRKCLTHYRALLANPNKLPLYSFNRENNKENNRGNNKIIDTWIKLLFEVSNERYEWANEFGQTVLEETFIRKSHEILSKEIDTSDEDKCDEEQIDEEQIDEVQIDEVQIDEEQNEFTIEIVNDMIVNPLFDEPSIMNEKKYSVKKRDANDNKKSGWFGWLGWN